MKPNPLTVLLLVCAPCWAQTGPTAESSMRAVENSSAAAPGSADAAPAVAAIGVPAGAAARRPGLAPTESAPDKNEPNVRHSVIEDKGAKIDELVVRGQVQRVVVTPKVGTGKSYEIIVNRSGRDTTQGTVGGDSAIGKRVWSVLAF